MTAPIITKTCPVCQFENPPDAAQCQRCSALLPASTTLPIPDLAAGPLAVTRPYTGQPPVSQTIGLHIVGEVLPIVIKDKVEITLGRGAFNEVPPTVDLTRYNAHVLGVSRRHAVIRYVGSGFTIEDLNSVNGTWVNENKLTPNQAQPLRHGDQVRLGQLIVFVSFLPVHTVTLIDKGSQPPAQGRISVGYLETQVVPFVKAVIELQTVINQMTGRNTSESGISSIVVTADNLLSVEMRSTSEAVKFIEEKLIPWKRRQPAPPSSNPTAAPEENAPSPNSSYAPLATDLLAQLAPTLSDESKNEHLQRLLPILAVLAASTLELSTH